MVTVKNAVELRRLRALADSIDCVLEEDVQLLAQVTCGTLEAWRKRGKGPAYVLFGNRYLYRRESVAAYLRSIARERGVSAGAAL